MANAAPLSRARELGEDDEHRSEGERTRRRHESEEQNAQREVPGRARCLSTRRAGTKCLMKLFIPAMTE